MAQAHDLRVDLGGAGQQRRQVGAPLESQRDRAVERRRRHRRRGQRRGQSQRRVGRQRQQRQQLGDRLARPPLGVDPLAVHAPAFDLGEAELDLRRSADVDSRAHRILQLPRQRLTIGGRLRQRRRQQRAHVGGAGACPCLDAGQPLARRRGVNRAVDLAKTRATLAGDLDRLLQVHAVAQPVAFGRTRRGVATGTDRERQRRIRRQRDRRLDPARGGDLRFRARTPDQCAGFARALHRLVEVQRDLAAGGLGNPERRSGDEN